MTVYRAAERAARTAPPARVVWLAALFGLGVLALAALPAAAGEVIKERFGGGATTASQAYAAAGAARVGLLVVSAEESPDPGFEYARRNLLTERRQLEGDPHRMPAPYELRLFEVIRSAFQASGYEVYCLNRRPWRDLQLKDLMARSDPGDLVCAVHYVIRRTRRILEAGDYGWWSPFEGMALSVRMSVYAAGSGERVHELELAALGTEALYEAVGDQVAEEPLHPTGYDRHGSPNAYRIAIYTTDLRDLRKGQTPVPVIRVAKGSLDIASEVGAWTRANYVMDEDEMRRLNIPVPEKVADQGSVLSRLLKHVAYRPDEEEIEFYDLQSVDRCGRLIQDRIPPRAGR